MDEFIEDLVEVQQEALESIIMLADKYEMDRDHAVQMFAKSFKIFSDIGTVANYEFKED